jgi:hypothetical protein
LELSSRQWFETDAMFQARIKVTQSNWERQLKQIKNSAAKKKTTATSTSTSKSTSATKWVLPGAKKPTGNAWSNTGGGSKNNKSNPKGSGGLFAAMMNDDSDSD